MSQITHSILVVDDDVDACENLSDIFRDLGHDVDVVHDGNAALDLVRKKPYDVALLDFKLPDMDGLTLYREIRKLRSETVSLIITAFPSPETRAAAREAGAFEILSKPVEFSKLLPLVEKAIRQPLILIVDDDRDLCESLWDIFRERGYRMARAHDVQTAKERLKENEFQVVLIDMKLPTGNGSNVLLQVGQSSPAARTILITGYRSEMELQIEEALHEGVDAVCCKPFDVPQLLKTVEKLSRRKGE
ncbi:MAG: response regulator [Planctomycetaceae bacterium]|nr:response regulator [Planctomycetaceae bacterium]